MQTRRTLRYIFPLLAGAFSLSAQSGGPAFPEPFAATPAQLLAAAAARPVPAGINAHVLFDDSRVVFDERGRRVDTWRRVFQIVTEEGLENWAKAGAEWAPWYQERPRIRARVITKNGQQHVLDPKTITEGPAREYDREIFSDRRALLAPLPAVAPGAVVEQEIITRDTTPYFAAGTAHRFNVAQSVPVGRFRLVVSAPASSALVVKTVLLPPSAMSRKQEGGRTVFTVDYGPLEAIGEAAPLLPGDVPRYAAVDFATGVSWKAVAAQYAAQVDAQLAGADVSGLLRGIPPGADTGEVIAAALAALHRDVRYTGLELGEASLIPRKPAELLARRYGDCKDKAALLVAMLRSRQIDAYVALLSTGPGRDVSPEQPGFGLFDHAIVHVPGPRAYWIDATATYAALGSLPSADRDRWALVASAATTGLVKTPSLRSEENRTIESREVFLAETGPARVVETTYPSLHGATNLRQFYATTDAKDLPKKLEGYVKSAYSAEALGKFEYSTPGDLAKAFELRIEALKASRGYTDTATASVAVPLGDLVQNLPEHLRSEPKPDAQAKLRERTEDFEIPEPFSIEWRYRIVPPKGFRARDLPKPSLKNLGPATLVQELTADVSGVVNAVFRFDCVKGRLTPKEAEALRKGAVDLREGQALMLRFDHPGEALLAQGKIPEALAEFRKWAAQEPRSAMDRLRIARALLKAGLGEAARAEAAEATGSEPKSAGAWRTRGWILQHDLAGRYRRPGMDLAGAQAAYRKAKELDPTDWTVRADFAILLEHDRMGDRYTSGANLTEAIAEYREAPPGKLTELGLADNLAFAMLYAGQFRELGAVLDKNKTMASARMIAVAAAAAGQGAAEGLREAATIASESERQQALWTAGNVLAKLRLYATAAELTAAGAQGAPNGAQLLTFANVLRNTKRLDQMPMDPGEPASVVRKLLAVLFADIEPAAADFLKLLIHNSKDLETETDASITSTLRAARRAVRRQTSASGLPLSVLGDIGMAAAQMSTEGDDSDGHRVRLRVPQPDGRVQMETYFVVREQGEYRILGSNNGLGDVAAEAMRRAAAGNLTGARRLLDWAREVVGRGGGDDPLSGLAFPHLWERGSEASRERIELAAASIRLSDPQALAALSAAREKADDESLARGLDFAIAQAAALQGRSRELLEAALRLRKAFPGSDRALQWEVSGRVLSGQYDEAEAAVQQRLAKLPGDAVAMRVGMGLAMERSQWDRLRQWSEQLVKAGQAGPEDYNNAAWAILVATGANDEAIRLAQKGASLARSFSFLHTLSAIFADAGRIGEAREYLLQAMDSGNLDEPNSECWLVLGQIADKLGLADQARVLYGRVEKPKRPVRNLGVTSFGLAQARLAKLGDKQP